MMNSNLLRFSFPNLSSPYDKENVKKKKKAYRCPYCAKEFSNYQSLRGYQRAHEDQIKNTSLIS